MWYAESTRQAVEQKSAQGIFAQNSLLHCSQFLCTNLPSLRQMFWPFHRVLIIGRFYAVMGLLWFWGFLAFYAQLVHKARPFWRNISFGISAFRSQATLQRLKLQHGSAILVASKTPLPHRMSSHAVACRSLDTLSGTARLHDMRDHDTRELLALCEKDPSAVAGSRGLPGSSFET